MANGELRSRICGRQNVSLQINFYNYKLVMFIIVWYFVYFDFLFYSVNCVYVFVEVTIKLRFMIALFIIHTYMPLTLYPRRHLRYSSETPTSYQNYLAIRNTADVTDGKPIAVWSLSMSGVSAFNLLVAFYDIHGRKREVLFFYFVTDTTRDFN
jgi:fermentation-respiration switch protein FrsA (DUF1100 family)